MKASEVLAAARDEIENGWTRGTFEDTHGSVCAVGAIHRAAEQKKATVTGLDGVIELAAAQEDATAAIQRLTREHGSGSIMGYNDHATDKQQVLDLFDKAIAGLEERGE